MKERIPGIKFQENKLWKAKKIILIKIITRCDACLALFIGVMQMM